MGTGWAKVNSLESLMDIATVATFPINLFTFLKHLVIFDIGQELFVSFVMPFFCISYIPKYIGDLLKAFFFSYISKHGVELCPFFVFASCCCLEVICCITLGYWKGSLNLYIGW